ncbi:hypothetical protein [Roseateles terrae]|uniref:Uncharacterized protein n=1 Tax=Roseateles terrae TaxID=431060 RepID=A0ABR6GUQ4_9BURK|nr:hypothetical protein [Roseateles terrae]MBB3195844.1 hypothetical protein [Roseateles terrae]
MPAFNDPPLLHEREWLANADRHLSDPRTTPDPAPHTGALHWLTDSQWCQRIQALSPQHAWVDLWQRVGAHRIEHHVAQREALLLRDVLALHHDVDPAAIFYGGYPYQAMHALARAYRHVPGDPMGRFCEQVQALQGTGWELLMIPPLALADPDRLVTWVPREVATTLFQRGEDARHFPYIDFRPRDVGGRLLQSNAMYCTPLLQVILELRELFTRAQAEGRYQEGDCRTVPLVGNFLDKYHPELSQPERTLVLRVVRPPWWPEGRPGKNESPFGQSARGVQDDNWC